MCMSLPPGDLNPSRCPSHPTPQTLRAHLVHCNDYYIGIGISITRNTLRWNVISITIH